MTLPGPSAIRIATVGLLISSSDASLNLGREPVICPKQISAVQELEKPVAGWEALRKPGPHWLMDISFYEGHPKEQGLLKPDEEYGFNKKPQAKWIFDNKYEHWLACVYEGTDVILVKKLDDKIRSCVVKYDPKIKIGGMPEIIEITCK